MPDKKNEVTVYHRETIEVYTGDGRKNKQSFTLNENQIQEVFDLAKQGHSIPTIASFFGVSKATFDRLRQRDAAVDEAVRHGRAKNLIDLMGKAKALAESGNDKVLLYLIERKRTDLEASDMIDERNEQERQMKDVGGSNNAPITRERLMDAIKRDPFLNDEEDADGQHDDEQG